MNDQNTAQSVKLLAKGLWEFKERSTFSPAEWTRSCFFFFTKEVALGVVAGEGQS